VAIGRPSDPAPGRPLSGPDPDPSVCGDGLVPAGGAVSVAGAVAVTSSPGGASWSPGAAAGRAHPAGPAIPTTAKATTTVPASVTANVATAAVTVSLHAIAARRSRPVRTIEALSLLVRPLSVIVGGGGWDTPRADDRRFRSVRRGIRIAPSVGFLLGGGRRLLAQGLPARPAARARRPPA
jgi:hypothetical protein